VKKLPTKTKIVAWFTIISGILEILNIGAYGFYMSSGPGPTPLGTSWAFSTVFNISNWIWKFLNPLASFILISVFYIGTFFITPIFLLWRKKWAWKFLIIAFFLSAFSFLEPIYSDRYSYDEGLGIFYPIFIFILLLLDRKNFFKVAK
jgi:hypothetical protein